MKIITASVAEQNLIIQPSVIGVSESVGVYSLKITYDGDWDGVDTKIVTFSAPNGASFAIQDNGEENGVTIPWEVLQCPGKVSVGVVGYAGTEQKITTTGLYDRNTFVVLPEAFGLQSAMTPTPDVYQKLIQTINQFDLGLEATNQNIGDLDDLETETKDNIVAAINEVLNGGGGSGTVKSVNNVAPDEDGNVELTANDVGAATPAQVNAVADDLATETNAREMADTTLQTAIAGKQATLSQEQLSAVNSGIDSTKVEQIAINASDIDTIEAKIPAQASAQNQLADKNFVNSSIGTNTAYYISDNGEPFSSLADLEAYSGTLTNNDYAFVVGTDTAGNTTYTRYKYNAETETWAEEYVLNNSSFTADQWAAISSLITAALVNKLQNLPADAEANEIDSISVNGITQTPDQNKNVDLTIPEEIRTLTSADTATYPGPTGTNGLGLWRLPTGIYKLQGITGYAKNNASITNPARPGALVMVSNDASNLGVFYTILCISGNNNEPGWFYDTISGRFNRVYLATSTGQNTDRGMTQKAITDVTTGLDARLTTVEGELTGLESALNTINNGGNA